MRENSTVYRLESFVSQHPAEKHYCGYVGVPQGHPLYGYSWYEPEEKRNFCPDVHGGLTYGDTDFPAYRSPEVHTLGKLNYWWLGFDQHHDMDDYYNICEDKAYCEMHTKKLLKQVRYYEQYGTLDNYEDQGYDCWESPLTAGPEDDEEDEDEECWWPDGA